MGARDWQSVPVAIAAVLLSVAAAAWILSAESPSPPEASPASSRGKAKRVAVPLAGSPSTLMLAGHSRDVLFGLAAAPGGPVDLVALTADGPVQRPLLDASVRSSRRRSVAVVRSCGFGCFRLATRALAGEPLGLSVRVPRPGGIARVEFRLPARLPPSGKALFRRFDRVMGSMRTVRIRQTLSSGKQVVRVLYAVKAPDRLRLETSNGQKTVLIRRRRWDFEDGRWVSASYPGTDVPSYFWEEGTHARIVGKGRVKGRRVTFVALFKGDRSFPAWFLVAVAGDGRIVRADMDAQAHFMTDWYSDFNKPISIQPPT